ncbi:MAG TPA: 3D-(3,5/4)-trihydroxycyclohexane-1,2-dione acylhydrolase (decyclizing), partial [Acidimicrobiales bacterium]|nr:3D-(3,5/4)-trihydroxycyclohexane-1,2-dione acylhydrolase (decyclizing) [Acidimicrobiales bacterium]
MSRAQTTRLTTAGAIVRWLVAQRTVIDDREVPLFPGVYAIFGHANVTCLGHALQQAGDALPTWRGQNEQGMALAAVAYAKAARRRQVMVATSSIGPGALNMVTAAGVAMADRLPLLLLAGDTFTSRVPDPVLQQIEHPGAPSITANDAFRAVVRFWDRITRPEQLVQSLPQALRVLLDPSECGPVFLALPQDTQAEAWDFPDLFFRPVVSVPTRPRPDRGEVQRAAAVLRSARRPLLVAGGGVHYSLAEAELAGFAERHRVPVVETVAGKASLVADHPGWAGPIGVTGWDTANQLASEADVVLAVGTRLQDFTTGSWTVFASDDVRFVGLNAARFDAVKHGAYALVGDAQVGLEELGAELREWKAPASWVGRAQALTAKGTALVEKATAPVRGVPSYAQVIGAVHRAATADDYVLTAAGGLPGELNANWLAKGIATFDCEYGFSCMGYEIAGGWGAAMARRSGEVFVLVGDGSYLMLNSELYSSVLSGHKMIVVVCDNGGFAVIERLQLQQGGKSFNNMIATSRVAAPIEVDFAAHAASLGCEAEIVAEVEELEQALARARRA